MPSQAVSEPVPHRGSAAAEAARAVRPGFAGLPDAARAAVGMTAAAAGQGQGSQAAPRRASNWLHVRSPRVRVSRGPWPREWSISLAKTAHPRTWLETGLSGIYPAAQGLAATRPEQLSQHGKKTIALPSPRAITNVPGNGLPLGHCPGPCRAAPPRARENTWRSAEGAILVGYVHVDLEGLCARTRPAGRRQGSHRRRRPPHHGGKPGHRRAGLARRRRRTLPGRVAGRDRPW